MIAVLPADVADDLLTELRRDLEARGWSSELSRGSEQVVLSLSGGGDPHALAGVFAGRVDADVMPILLGREYRMQRFRRRFASLVVLGLGFFFLGVLSLPVVGFLRPPHVQLVASDLVFAAPANSLLAGGTKRVTVHGQRVLFVRRDDGSAFGIGGRCTYLDGCLLEWSTTRHQVVCPCCGGAYDAYGNVIEGPPSIPLRTYAVERIGDEFFLRSES